MLILFFTCYALFAASDGFVSVAWFDILARAIPLERRGRLMGISYIISGLGGVGVGVLVGLVLDNPSFPFPVNYAFIFALTGVVFVPSVIALVSVREPSPERTRVETAGRVKGGWLSPLLNDPTFRRLMLCRFLVGLMTLAVPFYVGHAADVLHLSESVVGGFVAAQMLAKMVAGGLFGLVSERWGPRYVIRFGGAAAIAGPLFALLVHLTNGGWMVQAYPFVYVALGVLEGSWMLGFFNYLMEIAPADARPIYIGLGNTIMGVLTLAPTLGGWLLEATSYVELFGVTAALVTLGFLFTLGLKPTRQAVPVESQL
jgi:MFS family permease